MSVALNLACISNREIICICHYAKRNIDNYRKEYDKKRDRCKKVLANLNPKEDAYMKYNAYTPQRFIPLFCAACLNPGMK